MKIPKLHSPRFYITCLCCLQLRPKRSNPWDVLGAQGNVVQVFLQCECVIFSFRIDDKTEKMQRPYVLPPKFCNHFIKYPRNSESYFRTHYTKRFYKNSISPVIFPFSFSSVSIRGYWWRMNPLASTETMKRRLHRRIRTLEVS